MAQVATARLSSKLAAFDGTTKTTVSAEGQSQAPSLHTNARYMCLAVARPSSAVAGGQRVFTPVQVWRSQEMVIGTRAFLCGTPMLPQQQRRRPRMGQNGGVVSAELTSLVETEAVPVKTGDGSLQKFPAAPGVYAVYDSDRELQYVGLSRKVSASIEAHVEDLPELTSSVKVAVVQNVDRAALQTAWKTWIEEYIKQEGKVPPGNVTGNDMWTKRKSRGAKPEIRLTPGANVKLTVPLTEIIDKVVKEVPVVAFIKGTRTAPQCGFSYRVLTLLNENKIDYEVVNVLDEDHNPGLRDAIKQYSQWPTIPQVFVKGEFIGGADILEEMVQKNELKPLISK